ncbi:MAG: BolA family transcriptional regulator [Pseudomonadales bacterium]|nr:BolA family transcriptional regulator [Pseudomonadales bacterium]
MSQTGSVQASIERKLRDRFQPSVLDVINESHMHNVPPDSETHFKVVVVTPAFAGKRSVARHQQIYQALVEEMAGPVHALAIHTYTDEEWQRLGAESPDSPRCRGGSKADQH